MFCVRCDGVSLLPFFVNLNVYVGSSCVVFISMAETRISLASFLDAIVLIVFHKISDGSKGMEAFGVTLCHSSPASSITSDSSWPALKCRTRSVPTSYRLSVHVAFRNYIILYIYSDALAANLPCIAYAVSSDCALYLLPLAPLLSIHLSVFPSSYRSLA